MYLPNNSNHQIYLSDLTVLFQIFHLPKSPVLLWLENILLQLKFLTMKSTDIFDH